MPKHDPSILNQWRFLHPYVYERGITREVAIKMRLGYDESHDAIVIPHFFNKELTGWQKRHLGTCDLCEPPTPKYKSSDYFPKNRTLYAFDELKDDLATTDSYVIVVESPMTALRLRSLGITNVVATFGAYSREQGLLLQPIETLFFWPDNDGAGFKNAKRCIDVNRIFNKVKIVPAVLGEKSDAALLDNKEEVESYLNLAYPASLFPLISKEKLATFTEVSER